MTSDFRLRWNHNNIINTNTINPKLENYNAQSLDNHEQLERIIILYLTVQILVRLNDKKVFLFYVGITYYIVSCTYISYVILAPSLRFL